MDILLATCRFLHYGAAALLFGLALFQSLLAPAPLRESLSAQVLPPARALVLLSLLTAFLWLLIVAASLGDGWQSALDASTLLAVLRETEFGRLWCWRLILLAATVALIVLPMTEVLRWRLLAVLGGLALATLGLLGHATAAGGLAGTLGAVSQAVHLLCVGCWLGCLPPVALACRAAGQFPPREAGHALRRFSTLGHVAVAGVILTGCVNIALISGVWPFVRLDRYQTLLLAKIGTVLLMVALALFNRYRIVPRLRLDPARFSATLRANCWLEVALGALVLALVAFLGMISPA